MSLETHFEGFGEKCIILIKEKGSADKALDFLLDKKIAITMKELNEGISKAQKKGDMNTMLYYINQIKDLNGYRIKLKSSNEYVVIHNMLHRAENYLKKLE